MPIYNVEAPNGKILKVEGPEGATADQVTQFAAREYYSDPANVEKKYTVGQTLGKAFDRGSRRLGSTFGDLIPAIGASAIGFDEYAEKQLDEAEQSEAYIQRNLAPKYPSFKDVDSVGSALEFAGETVFEQFPNLATMLVTGGVGSGLGRVGVAKLGASALAKRQAVGQGTGVYLGSYALNAPEIFQNIYDETGQLAPGASLLFGAAAAGLDSVLPANILKGMTPAVKAAITKETLKKSGMRPGLAESIFKNILKGTAQEGITEGAQEAISITAENFVGDNPQIFESEDWERIIESSVRGAVAGGVFRGASAPIERLSIPAAPTQETVPAPASGNMIVDPALVKRKQASATTLGLTLVPSPDIAGDFAEAIKIREVEQPTALGDGLETVSIRDIYQFNEKSNKWVKVREELVEGTIKEGLKEDDEEEVPTGAPSQLGLPGIPEELAGPVISEQTQELVEGETSTGTPTGAAPIKQPFLPFSSFPAPPPKRDDIPSEIRLEPGPVDRGPQDRESLAEAMGWQYDDVTNTAYDAEAKITYVFDEANNQWVESDEKLNRQQSESSRTDNAILGKPGLNERADSTSSTTSSGVGSSGRTVSKNSNGATVVYDPLGPENKPVVTENSTWTEQFPGAQIASEVQEMGSDQGGISDSLADRISRENYVSDSVPIADLINSDPYLKEYIEKSPEGPREFQQSETQVAPVVASNGEVLDGYNRIQAALVRGDKTISVLRGVKPWSTPEVEITEGRRARLSTNELSQQNRRFKNAQEMKEELYKEFGKTLIDRLLNRGFLKIIDSRADLSDANKRSIPSGVTGFYQFNPKGDKFRTGVTTLIANKNAVGSASGLLLHEIGEHYGLEGMLGKDYAITLNQLNRLKDTDPIVARAWKDVTINYATPGMIAADPSYNIGGINFLREVAAHIGETAPENTWFRRLIGRVKNFLRRLGFYDPSKITGSDIRDMIMYSLNRTLNSPIARTRLNPNEEVKSLYKKSVTDEIYSKENPPGAFRPETSRKLLDMAGEGYKSIQKGSPKVYAAVRKALSMLPDSLMSAKMGMYGLVALNDLYKNYMPSLGKMLELLELRAGKADKARAKVDNLGYMGMNAVKGNKRVAFKFVDEKGNEIPFADFFNGNKRVKEGYRIEKIPTEEVTTKHTQKELDDWARIVFNLSRGEAGYLDKGIDPTDVNNQGNPLVGEFKRLPKELQMLAIAYSAQYTQFAQQFNAAVLKLLPNTDKKGRAIPMGEKAKRFKEQLISQELVFYHPFRRRGAYVLKYIPKADRGQEFGNEIFTERFETNYELEAAIADLKRTGGQFISSGVSPETGGGKNQVPDAFFQEIIEIVNSTTTGDSQINEGIIEQIYELYVDMFPSSSVRQQTRKRDGVRGELQDVVGGFIDVGARMANQVTNMEYIPQFNEASAAISEESRIAQETVSNDDTIEPQKKEKLKYQIAEAAIEVTDRSRAFFNNPVPDRLSGNLAYVSFLTTIAGNVSSALVNLTQVLLIVIPGLVAKYGPVKAAQAMALATKLYLNGGQDNNRGWQGIKGFGGPDISYAMKNGFRRSQENAARGLIDQADVLPQELLDLYEQGLERSVFRRGLGYELTEMRKKDSQDFTGVKAKVDSTLGWIFQNTERFNREVTYLAGYIADRDISLDKEGNFNVGDKAKSVDKATEYARDFTRESHGTALPELGPRHFQDGWGKTIFTFKRYAHAMMAVLIKLFYNSMKGGDIRRDELARAIAEVRATEQFSPEANAKVAEMENEIAALKLVKRTARVQLAGIYGMSFTVAGVQGMPLYGLAETFSETMYAMFGDEDEPYDFDESVKDLFGEFGYKGPLNKLLDTDIAARTGFSNLIWRDDARRVQEIGVPGYVLETLLGPSYSYARNIGRGIEDISEGNVYRGVEQMLPAFARNGMKSIRYSIEGARTRGGAKLVDDLNAYNNFMQVFGFTNEDLSNAYERNNAMKQGERRILRRRSGLLTAAFVARDSGDRELLRDVQEEIKKYNRTEVGRLNRITSNTLNSSYKAKSRAIANSVNGITLSEKYKKYLRENLGS